MPPPSRRRAQWSDRRRRWRVCSNPRTATASGGGAPRADLAWQRRRLRELLPVGTFIAEHAEHAACGTHLDREPRVGIEHRRDDPRETVARERAAPRGQALAAGAAVGRGLLEGALEHVFGADAAFPFRLADQPVIGGATVALADVETILGALDHAVLAGPAAGQRVDHRS